MSSCAKIVRKKLLGGWIGWNGTETIRTRPGESLYHFIDDLHANDIGDGDKHQNFGFKRFPTVPQANQSVPFGGHLNENGNPKFHTPTQTIRPATKHLPSSLCCPLKCLPSAMAPQRIQSFRGHPFCPHKNIPL